MGEAKRRKEIDPNYGQSRSIVDIQSAQLSDTSRATPRSFRNNYLKYLWMTIAADFEATQKEGDRQ